MIVLQAIVALPKRYKEAMYWHYYIGYSVEETAKLLHISASAVKMRLLRGREMIKTMLTEQEEET